ncbi:tape measure protein [Anaerovibrio slackiae]|uniref:tape measure protein n=1 Tax=Anaerovibrio slackiae TaxID=2652309 RepID=UPI003869F411
MGAVRSQLVINDGMTSALRRINKAMSLMIGNFEAVQRASGQSINTSNLNAARQEIGRANAQLDVMEQNYRAINDQQNNLNRGLNTGTKNAGGLLSKIKSVAAAYLGMKGITATVGLSDTMTSNRARLELIVDDGGSVAELEQKIYASAQRARAGFTETMATVSKLGLVAGKAFRSNDEIIAFQELVNKNFVVGGASATEQASAMYQLTQAMGSGRLQGDEYRSIIENAPLLAKSIEDYMRNVQGATGTMKDWASEGKLTADVIKAAVFNSADEVEERFNKMPKTWSQVWTSMKNRAIKAMDPVLVKINQLANNAKVQKTINGLVNGFALVANVAAGAFEVISNIYAFMSDNWSTIGPIIMGVVAALLLYKGAVLAITAIETISAVVKGVLAAAQMMQTGATFAATAAQYGLNAALWACPITWIIALIIALIVVFVIFTEQITGAIWWLGALFKNVGLWIANCGLAAWQVIKNVGLWFANLGLAIWQVIKNIGAWFANLGASAWAIIKNTGLWFANLGMGIWNVLKAAASNVGTAFKNAWIGIQIGFWTMLDVIMQGIKSLAEKANKCLGWMGVNIDTSGLDFASKKIDELNGKKESYESISDAWAEGFNTFAYDSVSDAWNSHDYGSVGDAMGTFDYGSVGDAFNTFDTFQDGWGSDAYAAGAEVGAGIKDWMGDNLSVNGILEKMGVSTGPETTDPLGYGSTLDDIAGDTQSLAGSTDKTTEELAYLRDIAEQEAINRFTTAEVKIDMTGMTNRIDSNLDIDGVVGQLTDGFVDALSTAAEGVHDDEL